MSAFREAVRSLSGSVFADILESDDSYLLVVDLPGTTPETVDIRVEEAVLRIEGRRRKTVPPSFQYRTEERSLFLDATFPLPTDVSTEGASATMADGVLELTLPKGTERSETEIPVENRA